MRRLLIVAVALTLGCTTGSLVAELFTNEPTDLASCLRKVDTELVAAVVVCSKAFSTEAGQRECSSTARGLHALARQECQVEFPAES